MGAVFGKEEEEEVPKFTIDGHRYDQETFMGRWKYFQEVTSPMTLFTSQDTLDSACKLLSDFEHGHLPASVTDEELWNAKRIKNAVVHPDTGESVPTPFRMSAFTPANIPICVLLLWPNPSAAMQITSQWVNQSYNLCVNYANRNASSDMSMQKLGLSYGAAVGTSCGIALGLTSLIARSKNVLSPRMAGIFATVIPFIAVSAAGCINVAAIRSGELTEGVSVTNKKGDVVYGKSIVAGRDGIAKCCLARVVWTAPTLLCVPVITAGLKKFCKPLFANKRIAMATELTVIAGVLGSAVPPAIAMFPQRAKIACHELEEKFHDLNDENGKNVLEVYYNKGL